MQDALHNKGKVYMGSGIEYDASDPEQAKWLKSSIESYSKAAGEMEDTLYQIKW